MTIFSSVLTDLMRTRNISDEQLATLVGVNRTTVTRWRTGDRSPKMEKLSEIAAVFNVDPRIFVGEQLPSATLSLVTETTAKLNEDRQKVVLATAEQELAEQNNVISLDAYKENRQGEMRGALGAGAGVNNFYEDIENVEDHEWPMIDIPDNAPYDFDWVYTASGDSMEPMYKDGDIIYAKELGASERSNLSPDKIYVVRVNGDSYLKKIRTTENGAYLVSLNPKYDDIPLSSDDDIKIVAKAVM